MTDEEVRAVNDASLRAQHHARTATNLLDVMDHVMDEITLGDEKSRTDAHSKLITLAAFAREAADKARAINEQIECMTIKTSDGEADHG